MNSLSLYALLEPWLKDTHIMHMYVNYSINNQLPNLYSWMLFFHTHATVRRWSHGQESLCLQFSVLHIFVMSSSYNQRLTQISLFVILYALHSCIGLFAFFWCWREKSHNQFQLVISFLVFFFQFAWFFGDDLHMETAQTCSFCVSLTAEWHVTYTQYFRISLPQTFFILTGHFGCTLHASKLHPKESACLSQETGSCSRAEAGNDPIILRPVRYIQIDLRNLQWLRNLSLYFIFKIFIISHMRFLLSLTALSDIYFVNLMGDFLMVLWNTISSCYTLQ